jgi:hypothetical protein
MPRGHIPANGAKVPSGNAMEPMEYELAMVVGDMHAAMKLQTSMKILNHQTSDGAHSAVKIT